MTKNQYPNMTRHSFRMMRNEHKRDNCRENIRRRKRGKPPMRLKVINNRSVWMPS